MMNFFKIDLILIYNLKSTVNFYYRISRISFIYKSAEIVFYIAEKRVITRVISIITCLNFFLIIFK